jgi:hypothetical protein
VIGVLLKYDDLVDKKSISAKSGPFYPQNGAVLGKNGSV